MIVWTDFQFTTHAPCIAAQDVYSPVTFSWLNCSHLRSLHAVHLLNLRNRMYTRCKYPCTVPLLPQNNIVPWTSVLLLTLCIARYNQAWAWVGHGPPSERWKGLALKRPQKTTVKNENRTNGGSSGQGWVRAPVEVGQVTWGLQVHGKGPEKMTLQKMLITTYSLTTGKVGQIRCQSCVRIMMGEGEMWHAEIDLFSILVYILSFDIFLCVCRPVVAYTWSLSGNTSSLRYRYSLRCHTQVA